MRKKKIMFFLCLINNPVCVEVYYTLIWPGGYLSPAFNVERRKNIKKTAYCFTVLFFFMEMEIWSWFYRIFLIFFLQRAMLKQQPKQQEQNTTFKIKKWKKSEKQNLNVLFLFLSFFEKNNNEKEHIKKHRTAA